MQIRSVVVVVALGLASSAAMAQQAVQWRIQDGGNGHWYAAVENPVTPGEPWGWYEAKSWSTSRGGNLASVASAAENQFIFATLANNPALWRMGHNNMYSFGPWIGLHAVSGAWTWSDGDPYLYANWAPGEPYKGTWGYGHYYRYYQQPGTPQPDDRWDNTGPERCVAAIIEWSADCNGDGIVDFGQCRDGSLPDYDGNNVPDCCEVGVPCTVGRYPVQWPVSEGGNGHWYLMHITEGTTLWSEARGRAESFGGHLATITSSPENDVCLRIAYNGPTASGGSAWLGGFQASDPAPYGWVTGETFSWAPACSLSNDQTHCGRENYLTILSPWTGCAWNDVAVCWQMPAMIIEWSADCNGDDIVDYGQILDGTFVDVDSNGIPDTCECLADLTGDGVVNGGDLSIVLGFWGTPAKTLPAADLNRDGTVDAADLAAILGSWGPCP
jgi:hypothetical protein